MLGSSNSAMYKRTARGMARLRERARDGDSTAASNIAAEYRILKRPQLAFRWYVRAVELWENGDDLLEMGYCLQHGVGVRRDLAAARRTYERALRMSNTTEYGLEEVRYHLATLVLETRPRTLARAIRLLAAASADGDYPQARSLLEQLSSGRNISAVCHCRRGLLRSLGGSAHCALHRPRKIRPSR